jgi:hypothetical protein
MAKIKTYRGRGADEITGILKNSNGPLLGQIIRATGEPVADVEFRMEGTQLILTVAGEEYSSITNALHKLAPEVATHDADGSEGSGNVANNVIGNYAILKHVVFGGQTMYEIVGGDAVAVKKPKEKKPAKAKVIKVERKDPASCPASGNLYEFFTRNQVVDIARAQGGAEAFQAMIKGMTINQFATKFGLTVA